MKPNLSASFMKRANEAAFWEAWVGTVLARANLFTVHHPFPADGTDMGKTWDLDVSSDLDKPWSSWRHVECKGLSLTFNNPDDYPFDNVLVCSKNSWCRKWGDALDSRRDFLFISRTTGSIVWLPVGTLVKAVTVTDTTRNETYKAMQTTKDSLRSLAEFVEVARGNEKE